MHRKGMGRIRTPSLPPARALREGSSLVPRGPRLSTRLSYVARRLRPGATAVVGVVFALWPLVAVVALAVGLVWGAALSSSP